MSASELDGNGSHKAFPSPWLWLQLLSLDAVAVAVVWQGLLGAVWQVPLSWADRLVLALTVWLVYVGDRWLDARGGKDDTVRHRFYGRHRRFFFAAMCVVAPVTGLLALSFLDYRVLFDGILLGVGVCLYLTLVNHGPGWVEKLKPLAVGVVFTLGCALAPLALDPHFSLLHVLMPVAFMLLAWVNCQLVAAWEFEQAYGREYDFSITNLWGLVICVFLEPLFLLLLVFGTGWVSLALFVSMGLLGVLVFQVRTDASAELKSFLADLALLLPMLAVWMWLVFGA